MKLYVNTHQADRQSPRKSSVYADNLGNNPKQENKTPVEDLTKQVDDLVERIKSLDCEGCGKHTLKLEPCEFCGFENLMMNKVVREELKEAKALKEKIELEIKIISEDPNLEVDDERKEAIKKLNEVIGNG